jgi:hypothetical protein
MRFAGASMVSINEELEVAKAANTAIKALLAATSKPAALATLKNAYRAAVLNLSRGGALNEARGKVGIAISNINARSANEREDRRGQVSNRHLDSGIGRQLMKAPIQLALATLSISTAQAAEPAGTLTLACQGTVTG